MTLTDNEKKFLRAARNGELDTIKELITTEKISLKQHDEIRGVGGNTALIWASWTGHLQIVRFLVEDNSVDVHGKSNAGSTALYFASRNDHVEIMKLLIFNGADVNQQNNSGETPLREASICGKLSAVNLLLEMGADPTIQNNFNYTALDWARQEGYTDVVNAIEQHIQRQQQIEELLRCNDRLPIAIWPNAFSHLKSVNFIYQLVCGLPQLFKQPQEEAEKNQKPKFSVPHPNRPACNKKRKRQTHEADRQCKMTKVSGRMSLVVSNRPTSYINFFLKFHICFNKTQ